jgi:hypothetical protein
MGSPLILLPVCASPEGDEDATEDGGRPPSDDPDTIAVITKS